MKLLNRVYIGGGDWEAFEPFKLENNWTIDYLFSAYGGRCYSHKSIGSFKTKEDAYLEAEKMAKNLKSKVGVLV